MESHHKHQQVINVTFINNTLCADIIIIEYREYGL